MTIFLTILGIYIGMVILSLLDDYIDFRKNYCKKGKKYTFSDMCKFMNDEYLMICLIPGANIATALYSLGHLLIQFIYNKIKDIRIV